MEFEEAKPKHRNTGTSRYIENGQLKITSYGIYFGEKTYEELGKPARIGVSVDRKNKLIMLEPRGEENRTNSWAPAKYLSKTTGTMIYRLRSTKSPLVVALPLGIYYPIGGGVFAFNEQNNNL